MGEGLTGNTPLNELYTNSMSLYVRQKAVSAPCVRRSLVQLSARSQKTLRAQDEFSCLVTFLPWRELHVYAKQLYVHHLRAVNNVIKIKAAAMLLYLVVQILY